MPYIKEITQVGGSNTVLVCRDSLFINHLNKQDSFISNQSVFNYVAPLSKPNTIFTYNSSPQSPKEKHLNDVFNCKFDSDVNCKSESEPKKQYKVYSPEIKVEIIEYVKFNSNIGIKTWD